MPRPNILEIIGICRTIFFLTEEFNKNEIDEEEYLDDLDFHLEDLVNKVRDLRPMG